MVSAGALAQQTSKVYLTREISPESLVKIYKALGVEAKGRVAVKMSTGEGSNPNYLKPELVKNLIWEVDGTIVECNTAYSSGAGNEQDDRNSSANHWKVIERHGFTKYFPVDIMDEYDEIRIPVKDQTHIKYDIVGGHMANYDFMIALNHFKGHPMGYDPATGVISYEGDPNRKSTNHLATIMGGFEVMNELLPLLPSAEKQWPGLAAKFSNTWLDYAQRYKQMSRGSFPVRRLLAYSAWQKRSPQLTAEAWRDLWGRIEHTSAPAFRIDRIEPPQVPAPIDYWWGISTNDAALWSLDAIYMIETLQDTTF